MGEGQREGAVQGRIAWLAGALGLLLVALIAAPLAASLGVPLLRGVAHALVVIDAPTHVDAVAIHGGGGDRREREIPAVLLLGNHADFLVTMGGPLPSGDPDITYAGATARRLREIGLYDDDRMVTLASGASTEGELRALRGEAERRGWRSLALSTVSWHTRRVDVTAAWVFAGSGIDVSVIAIPVGGDLDLDEWWKSAWGRRVIAGEWAKLLFFALSR